MRGTPEQRKHIGAIIPTGKEFVIYTLWEGKVAIEPGAESREIGLAQRKVGTVPKGTFLTVKGLVIRNCPWGSPEYYVCRAPQQKITFDLQTTHADQGGFLDWNSDQNASIRKIPVQRP
jgi:hypothetical protein